MSAVAWPECGWIKFPREDALAMWAAHADVAARKAVQDPAMAEWLRCGGTWFVGVNALPNDANGVLPGGPALTGTAIEKAQALARWCPLDRAQASVCYPGYPAQGEEESESAFRYRRDRDAAHVDGLHRIMPGRRRMLKERHAYILGIPLNDAPADAAPLVVWEGSHEIMRAAFNARFRGVAPGAWSDEDVTEVYQTARREVFETCQRVTVSAKPGEAYLVHRLALHGVAPWKAGEGRRAIAYFRPEYPETAPDDAWLTAP
ncbi:MAG: hypothetical protein AAF401_01775 [Pseudomonadota bacterium]